MKHKYVACLCAKNNSRFFKGERTLNNMFGSLKEKLKGWTEKIKQEFASDSAKPEISKKTNKKAKSKPKVEKTKKSKSKKIEKIEKIQEEKIKEIKPEAQQRPSKAIPLGSHQEEKGFLSKLFHKEKGPQGHPERDKSSELILEDISKEQKIESPETLYEAQQSHPSGKQEKKEHIGFFDSFKKKITPENFEKFFQELEMMLLQNNVAYGAVQSIKQNLEKEIMGKNVSDVNIEKELKIAIENLLQDPPNFVKLIKEKLKEKKPFVAIFVGINGSGKTTTIAKLAQKLKKEKLSVCLAAADTWRAAAMEQLEIHGERLSIPVIKKDYGTDPAAVGFDAITYAKKNNIDVVLIDTAGRMNTKESLMKEMEKMTRVCNPDLKIFIGESITGNDATEQAKAFNESINLDGIILSKADVDDKGGTALSVSYITKKPIFFLGTGQTYDDLEIFDKKKVIEHLGL